MLIFFNIISQDIHNHNSNNIKQKNKLKVSLLLLFRFGCLCWLLLSCHYFCFVNASKQETNQNSSSTIDNENKQCTENNDNGSCENNNNNNNNDIAAGGGDTTNSGLENVIDEFKGKTNEFLQNKVFGQKYNQQQEQQGKESHRNFFDVIFGNSDTISATKQPSDGGDKPSPFEQFRLACDAALTLLGAKGGNDNSTTTTTITDVADEIINDLETSSTQHNNFVQTIVERARLIGQGEDQDDKFDLKVFTDAISQVRDQLQNSLGDAFQGVDALISIAAMYFVETEDARKNPSWKRRQHKFYKQPSREMIISLHDALYLSQLSYVNSLDEFKKGLEAFQDNTWEIIYGTTDSKPNLPAHFLLIHKEIAPLSYRGLDSLLPWEDNKSNELYVTLLVRGTKTFADVLSDGLLEPSEYRGGYAHAGILASGKAIAEINLPKLQALRKYSGRKTIKLYLVGHSLGAGAAAIAAMELNDHPFIQAESVGFGCPPLLSFNISTSVKDIVTTVVADSDIVPRMSGASIVNVVFDLLEFNWTDAALGDLEHSYMRIQEDVSLFSSLLPKRETIMKWFQEWIAQVFPVERPVNQRERLEPLLFPPGECVHIYRDGVSYSGSFTPCNFFSEIDVSRSLIDDHMVMEGYHKAMITLIRDMDRNHKFDFIHDIAAIPA